MSRVLKMTLVTVLGVAGVVMAQPAPANGGGGAGGGGAGGGPPGQRDGGNGGSSHVQEAQKAVTEARKAVSEAQTEMGKAQRAFVALRKKLTAEVEAKLDVVAASQAVADAKKTYEEAMKPVLAALAATPEYKAADAVAVATKARVDELAGSATPAPEAEVTAAANAYASAQTSISALRTKALDASPEVVATHARYTELLGALAKLRQQYLDFSQNPEFTAAKEAVDDATAKLKSAQAELAEAQKDLTQARADAAAMQKQQQQQQQQHQGGPGGGGGGGGGPPR